MLEALGNDLVDLRVVRPWRPARLPKVLLPTEQQWLGRQPEVEAAFWWLWSAKESAYKAWARRSGQRRWNPKAFAVQPPAYLPEAARFHWQVDTPFGPAFGTTNALPDGWHSWVVAKKDAPIQAAVNRLPGPASRLIQRQQLALLYQEYTGFSLPAYAPGGIPRDAESGWQLSLSHDGGYVAMVRRATSDERRAMWRFATKR
jgi:hypothetical protein